MKGTRTSKETYYQTIAREFIGRRGAPFYLSPKDVALIEHWEKAGIPLDAVLEGMNTAVENFRKGGRPVKTLALASCEYQIMKAFGQHSERKAGGARKIVTRGEKKKRLAKEIERFLAAVPPELEGLRPKFNQAFEILARPGAEEEALEALDESVDEALSLAASKEEKETVRSGIRGEFAARRGLDLKGIERTRLVKVLRERFKIPYLSLFYY
jgi:hypothetical protein